MENYFRQVKAYIEGNYSNSGEVWHITGANYPPSSFKVIISNIATACWMFGIALLFAGHSIFDFMGIKAPQFVNEIQNNKVTFFIVIFMINNFGNSLLSTGAFEVYSNESLIYSKLKTGVLPNIHEINRIAEAIMKSK